MGKKSESLYEVLNPWAEADTVPFRAISPRIDDLDGKNIGLFCNTKRVARPALKALEDRLKNKYPSAVISWFFNIAPNQAIAEQPRKGEFEKWLKGVDAVIAAYGD